MSENIMILDETDIDEILAEEDEMNPLENAIRLYGSLEQN